MSWKDSLAKNITTADDIVKRVSLSEEEQEKIRQYTEKYPMSVPEYYVNLINWDDPDDPIRKIAIPRTDAFKQDGVLDTSGESSNTVLQGVQHKYRATVLVLTSPACAMVCRHCFRKRFVGKEDTEIAQNPAEVAGYLKEHPEVNNVLLSGGDSFILDNEKIKGWLDAMTQVDTLDFIRMGTRVPVSFPERINSDPELLEILKKAGEKKQIYIVTQFDHPRELTEEAGKSVKLLQEQGIVVKNQTVLLKGINDDPAVMGDLLRKMSSVGIVQHYIFQCRPVVGAMNYFQVPLTQGIKIIDEVYKNQNGLGKAADYAMSHPTGKIKILGELDGKTVFQYKQAKNPENTGKVFMLDSDDERCWIGPDEIKL